MRCDMKLAIVHTSFALVEPLNLLIKQELPSVEVINIVDDTTLAYARKWGVDSGLTRRMLQYFEAAVLAKADIILNACSSVAETVDTARKLISIPILKIDEPMVEKSLNIGRNILVVATVASTLGPTTRLIESMAKDNGKDVQVVPLLCEGAFEMLLAGNFEAHDTFVTSKIFSIAADFDVILLAQASMARVIPTLEKGINTPVLTSPRLAVLRIKEMFADFEK
jgi:Asp/Glu/hydantoin racemase